MWPDHCCPRCGDPWDEDNDVCPSCCEWCGDMTALLDGGLCARCFIAAHDGTTPTGFASHLGPEDES
jgi:hypothetical protein